MPGDENDWWFGTPRREQILKLEAGHTSEVNVEDDAIRLARICSLEEILSRLERLRPDTVASKHTRERSAERCIVVHNPNPRVLLADRRVGFFRCSHATSTDGQNPAILSGSASAGHWTFGLQPSAPRTKLPIASFAYNCTARVPPPGYACAFDRGSSSDPDGSVAACVWTSPRKPTGAA
jgi:hypothetical protein